MIAFAIAFRRLYRIIRTGAMDPEFRALLVGVAATLLSGTIFYMFEEGWSLIDSLYFCVTTLTTIGFGDPSPTTALSKAFTIVYVIVGIGLIAAFVAAVADRSREIERERRERHPRG